MGYSTDMKPFCDGIEIIIGSITKESAARGKKNLQNLINSQVTARIVKNLLFTNRGGKTFLWLSFSYDSARLDANFIVDLRNILDAVRKHYAEWN